MTFILDGMTVGNFSKAPDGDTSYHFNQIVFSQTGLSNGSHSLQIQTGHAGAKALILLDSIIYTKDSGVDDEDSGTAVSVELGSATANVVPNDSPTETPGPSSTSRSKIGPIVGGVIGGLALIGLLCGLFLWFRRRQYPHSTFSRTRKGYNNTPDSGEAHQRQMDTTTITSTPTHMARGQATASMIGSSAYFATTIGSELDEEGMTETVTGMLTSEAGGRSSYAQSRWYPTSSAASGSISTNGAQVGHGNVASGSSSGVGSGIGYGVGVGLQDGGLGYAGNNAHSRGPLPPLPIGAMPPSSGLNQNMSIATQHSRVLPAVQEHTQVYDAKSALPPAYDTLAGGVGAAGRVGAEKGKGKAIKTRRGTALMRVVNAEIGSTYTSSEADEGDGDRMDVTSTRSRGKERAL